MVADHYLVSPRPIPTLSDSPQSVNQVPQIIVEYHSCPPQIPCGNVTATPDHYLPLPTQIPSLPSSQSLHPHTCRTRALQALSAAWQVVSATERQAGRPCAASAARATARRSQLRRRSPWARFHRSRQHTVVLSLVQQVSGMLHRGGLQLVPSILRSRPRLLRLRRRLVRPLELL